MAIEAHHLRIVNFSVNPEDTSAGLTLSLARVRLNLKQALNRPSPGKVVPGMSRITAKRWVVCGVSGLALLPDHRLHARTS